MNRLLTVLLFSATIASLFGLNETKKFCDAFEANNSTISYGYRRIIRFGIDSNLYHLYVFIDQSYWELNYTDGNDTKKKVSFISLDSQESNWFGDKYSIALCIYPDNKDDNCTTYLADFKRGVWDYTTLKDKTDLTMSGSASNVSITRMDLNSSKNYIAFVPNWGQLSNTKYNGLVVVLDKSKTGSYYEMEGTQPLGKVVNNVDAIKHEWLISMESEQKQRVVAILGQYSGWNEKNAPKGKKWFGQGVVILFKNETALQYCYSQAYNRSDSCKPENLQTLINCPKTTKTTTKPTQSPNDETTEKTTKSSTDRTTPKKPIDSDTDFTTLKVLGGVVLLVVILLIIIICCLCCCGKPEQKAIKGVKPSKKDQFSQLDRFKGQSGLDDSKESKSEMFSVKSSVDYTKPIPINSSTSVQPSTESIARPTDLNVRPKPK